MRNCSTFVIWINSHSKLLHMTNLQCKRSFHDLRCFDVILVLSQFTHFCVEQKSTPKSCPWSKNDKYYVWWGVVAQDYPPCIELSANHGSGSVPQMIQDVLLCNTIFRKNSKTRMTLQNYIAPPWNLCF